MMSEIWTCENEATVQKHRDYAERLNVPVEDLTVQLLSELWDRVEMLEVRSANAKPAGDDAGTQVKERTMTTERFDEIHEALASVGVCDGTGGMEYTNVKRRWIERGRPHGIAGFIETESNLMPTLGEASPSNVIGYDPELPF